MDKNTVTIPSPRFIVTSVLFKRLLQGARPFQKWNTIELKDGCLSIVGNDKKIRTLQINDQQGEGSVEFTAKKLNRLYTILNNLSEQPLVVVFDFTLELSQIYI